MRTQALAALFALSMASCASGPSNDTAGPRARDSALSSRTRRGNGCKPGRDSLLARFQDPGLRRDRRDCRAARGGLCGHRWVLRQGRPAGPRRRDRRQLRSSLRLFAPGDRLRPLGPAQGPSRSGSPSAVIHKRALAISEKALGPEQPDVATSLESYAALLRETGRGAEANKMEARAESIRAKHAR